MDPNLIPVFKPNNPDKVIYADQAQINSMPDKLIKVSDRAKWEAEQRKGARTGARSVSERPSTPAQTAPAPAAPAAKHETPAEPPVRTKAELLKLCEEKGIAATGRMTVAQLEKALASAK